MVHAVEMHESFVGLIEKLTGIHTHVYTYGQLKADLICIFLDRGKKLTQPLGQKWATCIQTIQSANRFEPRTFCEVQALTAAPVFHRTFHTFHYRYIQCISAWSLLFWYSSLPTLNYSISTVKITGKIKVKICNYQISWDCLKYPGANKQACETQCVSTVWISVDGF